MTEKFRFRDLQQARGVGRTFEVSLNDLYPEREIDADGNELPTGIKRPQLNRQEKRRLLEPYISSRLKDQLTAVVPLAAYLALFLILVLRQLVEDALMITGGLVAVVVGLMFFMEGLRIGLMPFGEQIGHSLPRRSPFPMGGDLTSAPSGAAPTSSRAQRREVRGAVPPQPAERSRPGAGCCRPRSSCIRIR